MQWLFRALKIVLLWCWLSRFSDCLYLFVYYLDENAVGFLEEGEFVEPEEQDQGPFVEQGKLLSDHAHSYEHLFNPHVTHEQLWF